MRKFLVLLLVLALALPAALPFVPTTVLAQDNPVQTRLEEYNANLPAGYGNVSVDDLVVELVENPAIVLVDVRQPEEYAEGHIEGAFNVPIRELAQHLDLLPDLNAKIVVICGSAFRSSIGMTSLQILGYTDVRSMSGGMRAWTAEEYPVVTDAVTVEAGTAPEIDADVLAAVDAQLAGLPEGYGGVSVENFNVELVDNPPAILIDVRTVDEWNTDGYIAGAVHMPLGEFMSFVEQWPAELDANIVITCKSGHRGNIAATMMRTMGYTNVRNLSGGLNAWAAAGLPVEGAAAVAPAELDLAALFDAYITNLPASFNAVRAADLNVELAENPALLLVDVRTPDEYVEGHLAGAINIPLTELTDHLDMLPALDQAMVIYCGSGHRSAMAMVALNVMGYTNARSMIGGIRAWAAAELPVDTEPVEATVGTAPAVDPALFAAVDAYLKAVPAGFYAISADDLNVALVENPPVLIDVRTDSEVAEGFIQGAIHIELRSFVARMSEWPTDQAAPVVIYCGSDHRAVIAMVAMQMMGYQDVRSLGGGLQAWLAAEYPVVTE